MREDKIQLPSRDEIEKMIERFAEANNLVADTPEDEQALRQLYMEERRRTLSVPGYHRPRIQEGDLTLPAGGRAHLDCRGGRPIAIHVGPRPFI